VEWIEVMAVGLLVLARKLDPENEFRMTVEAAVGAIHTA
jgi:hypothetical protein